MPPTELTLRPHQKNAVAAATWTLNQHPRARVIAACGSGKTFIAARTTARIDRRGRGLVLLPTLDLLSQMIRSWHEAGRKGPAVAVCSARQAPHARPSLRRRHQRLARHRREAVRRPQHPAGTHGSRRTSARR
ncbi:DEAD/DEAH box helicase family protein [Streptomyces sp. NPDC058320]|uniref:DEAD/DEAH box helicase family protein n=1 Tax=unclassified Streptomyces TaxID=2593676 RepID=UPI0036257D2D